MVLCAHFSYNCQNIVIQCRLEDQFGDVVKRFGCKINKEPESLLFLYNGRNLSGENRKIQNIITKTDLESEEFHVLVYPKDDDSDDDENQVTVEINYKNDIIKIMPEPNDKMENIFKKFLSIKRVDENSIYFCFMGRLVLKGLKLEDYLNYDGKSRSKLEISVIKRDSESIIKSNQIICPVCGEAAQIKLKNKKFEIFGCKYKHKIDDLTFNEFKKTQLIDISKIICHECKSNNKYNTYNNLFFYCFNCNKNLCPLCKFNHNINHKIVEYKQRFFYCNKHNKLYNFYCNVCQENICESCKSSHNNHEMIRYSKVAREKSDYTRRLNIFNENISDFGKIIKDIKEFLVKVEENLKMIYEFNNNIIKDYDPKMTNYQFLNNLQNLKELYSTNIQDIGNLKNSIDYQEIFNNIIKIYKDLSGDESISLEEQKIKEMENKIIENEKTMKEYRKAKRENENQIIDLKNKISEYEKLLSEEKRKATELDKKLKENESKGGLSSKYNSEKILELMEEINKKNKEIEQIRTSIPIRINPGERLMTVIFVSTDQKIHYAIICKNTDKFSTLENKLYDEYPEFSENENYFLVNGNRINRHKDLDYNNIKNSDIVTLFPME